MNTFVSFLFLLGLLAVDVVYVRWAWLSDHPADATTRIVVGVILALLTGLFLVALCHWVAARLKGGIKLEFANRPYHWDDVVTGEVMLHTRRRLVVERLTVTLCGWRTVHQGRNKSTRREVVVQIEQDLLAQENLLPDRRSYPFRLAFPPAPPVRDPVWPAGWEGLGKFFTGLQRLTDPSGLQGRLTWTLEARAHIPGADLMDERTLRFNWTPPAGQSANTPARPQAGDDKNLA
jgi:hypothetical protein